MISAVDDAIFEALRSDASLTTLSPGGIYRDAAPESAVNSAKDDALEVFGVVSTVRATLHHSFCGTGDLEESRYVVQFVAPASDPTGAEAALDRAVAVLPALAVPGYHVGCSRRSERAVNVIPEGPIRWQRRAVEWEIWAAPA